ncbi:MAG: DUF5131 family protein [Nitrosopumilaceae archaeon]|nr:DUF5131 family protein [Nitrosopumilaceae archaeon]NIU01758.1 DUF5131 family protein [Nitrosopumilaceae archaeon]NIU88158.1 DUF5131 family protein [Nitrosopumilaceae archaeon]NIV66481.1 DUF5131 family protein [Nitrosopumilaceae archaeon]NIX62360.1 DUF5131 family protein [Nitrosopumilaceae archaeon]
MLTPTGGFLSTFTHTLNPYTGCQLGYSFCGRYCYASAIAKGLRKDKRLWGSYLEVKSNSDERYKKEYTDIKKQNKSLKIFMSSVTDPYLPLEKEYNVTKKVLEAMLEMPPDSLVIQTHTPNVLRDLEILESLSKKTNLIIQITVETDKENLDLKDYQTKYKLRHLYPISSRLDALKKIKEVNLFSVATVSPLMPLNYPHKFASKLKDVANFVILDHFLLGDGSGGIRTGSRRFFSEPLSHVLANSNQTEWNTLKKFNEIVAIFRKVLGTENLGISKEGFARSVEVANTVNHS